MRSFGILGAVALASAGFAPAAAAVGSGEVIVIGAEDRLGPQVSIEAARVDRDTVEVRRAAAPTRRRYSLGKNPAHRKLKRPNRLHVSRRTRRRHRRAA